MLGTNIYFFFFVLCFGLNSFRLNSFRSSPENRRYLCFRENEESKKGKRKTGGEKRGEKNSTLWCRVFPTNSTTLFSPADSPILNRRAKFSDPCRLRLLPRPPREERGQTGTRRSTPAPPTRDRARRPAPRRSSPSRPSPSASSPTAPPPPPPPRSRPGSPPPRPRTTLQSSSRPSGPSWLPRPSWGATAPAAPRWSRRSRAPSSHSRGRSSAAAESAAGAPLLRRPCR